MQLVAKIRSVTLLSGIALLFCGSPVLADDTEDVVYIFSDVGIDAVHGIIVAEEPGESLRILTNEGQELVFDTGQIANVVRRADARAGKSQEELGVSDRAWSRSIRGKPSVSFRGWVGFSGQSLTHVNATIMEGEQALQSSGFSVNFDTFGGVMDFGGGISYRVLNITRVGFEVSYQTSQVQTGFFDASEWAANTIDLEVLDLSAVVEVDLPMLRGLFVGASAGVGIGGADQNYQYRDLVDSANDETSDSSWDGAGFAGGAYAGYSLGVSSKAALFVRGGYRLRDLGNFKGGTVLDTGETVTTQPVDSSDTPVEFDFSGPYARMGLTYTVGG